jgi:hypothetical protein
LRSVPPAIGPVLRAAFPTWRPVGLLLAALVLATAFGCAPHADIEFIDLNFKRIDAAGPLINHISASDCCWWIDGNHLMVTLHHDTGPLAGQLARERFDLSFVLDGLPANRARDYRLDRESLRAVYGKGAAHSRFASLRGITAVWWGANGTLRGRFRLIAKKQIFHVLTDWTDVGQVIMVGDFRCRRDRAGGRPVLERSEKNGMARRPARSAAQSEPGPVEVHGPPVEHLDKQPDQQPDRGGAPR